jgi:magnesium transporter
MLLVYQPARRALAPAERPLQPAGWIHVVAPSAEEIDEVARELRIPHAMVRHALDADELARVDHDPGGAVLIVVRVPAATDGEPVPWGAHAVGLILSGDLVITVTHAPTPIFEALAADPTLSCRPRRFALQLIDAAAARFMVDLRAIDDTVAAIEERLSASLQNREVLELLRYQKALVFFNTALRSNELMLERLGKDVHLGPLGDDADLLEDVGIEMRQALQNAAISSEILSQMMDAFASIVSNNLNVAMKVLTSLTIIVALPAWVASVYGMNVALPWQHSAWAFPGLMVVSVAIALWVGALLRRRGWV